MSGAAVQGFEVADANTLDRSLRDNIFATMNNPGRLQRRAIASIAALRKTFRRGQHRTKRPRNPSH